MPFLIPVGLAYAGGVVGGLIGGSIAVAVGQLAGTIIGGYLQRSIFGPDPTKAEIPRLDDLRVQAAGYGASISRIWGTQRVAGNVIWSRNLEERIEEVHVEGANNNYDAAFYYGTFAIQICQGEIVTIEKMWADNKLIYNTSDDNEEVVAIEGLEFKLYKGTETQDPDPTMEEILGAGNVPAYRGYAYIVFDGLKLEQFGNHIPNFNFQVVEAGYGGSSDVVTLDFPGIDDTIGHDGMGFFVMHPNETHVIAHEQLDPYRWYKLNLINRNVEIIADHDLGHASIGVEEFDIDEERRLYTVNRDSTNVYRYVALSADTLAVEQTAGFTLPWGKPSNIRVGQHPYSPFLFTVDSNANQEAWAVHRSLPAFEVPIEFSRDNVQTSGSWSFRDTVSTNDRNNLYFHYALFREIGGSNGTVIQRINVGLTGGVTGEWSVGSNIELGDRMCYDKSGRQIIVGSTSRNLIAFFDADDMAFLGSVDMTGKGVGHWNQWQRGVINGFLWIAEVNTGAPDYIHKINVRTREISESYYMGSTDFLGSSFSTGIYDAVGHSWISAISPSDTPSGSWVGKLLLDRVTPTLVPLEDVVTELCATVNIPSADIDVTDLTGDDVRGFALTDRVSARAALESLARAYFFDAVEVDGKIVFVKRGVASTAAITEDELATSYDGEQRPQLIVQTRQQEVELPQRVEIAYADVDAGYVVGTQAESRQITESDQTLAIEIPLAFTADEAKQIAVKHLGAIWSSRTGYTFSLPRDYADLVPTDVVTVTKGTATYTIRIERVERELSLIRVEGRSELAAAYTSDASGGALPVPDETVEWAGPCDLAVLDSMRWSSIMEDAPMVVAIQGYTDFWTGASIKRSPDGATWTQWAYSKNDAIIGSLTGDGLPSSTANPFLWDEASVVWVRLNNDDDTLDSYTETEVMDGTAPAVLIGNEILYYRDALQSTFGSTIGQWQLSGLLRGRFGTDWAMTHATGDQFVVLNMSQLKAVGFPVSELGNEAYFRATSFGMPLTSGTYDSLTVALRAFMPLSPEHIRGDRDVSDNLTITWMRRTRIDGDGAWMSGQATPLGEETESYEIDILGPDSSGVVKRTITATSETASYTAAQQTEDGYTPGDDVDLIIYQISARVGRGYGREETV
jgi:hypothetical protein